MSLRRREFIAGLPATAAWPLAARAQQPGSIKRVGVLIGTAEPEFQRRFEPFRQGLVQLGWTEPRNIRIDYRWTDNRRGLARTYAQELIGLAPDVIFAAPGPAAEVVQELTRTIPIVFVTSTDPARAGYVDSYARPGGNLTGFTNFEATIDEKYVQLIKEIAPRTTRIGVLRTALLARGREDVTILPISSAPFWFSRASRTAD